MADIELKEGERVEREVPYEGNLTLVSDGNSRWEVVDGVAYLVVNDNWQDPERQA